MTLNETERGDLRGRPVEKDKKKKEGKTIQASYSSSVKYLTTRETDLKYIPITK